MPNGLVSIVIPTRNRAHYLKAALDSVYAQSYPHFEIIVVDDGSTDDTRAIAHAYDDRLHYIYQPAQGVSAARNSAIRTARGDYVAFLDDDDIFLPEKLRLCVERFAADPDLIWLCSGFAFIDAEGALLPRAAIIPEKPEVTLHDIALFSFIHTSSVVVRKSALNAVGGFPEGSRVSEDYHMWAQLLAIGKGAALPQCLTYFRQHAGNTKLPYRTVLRENARILNTILATRSPVLLPKKVYRKNLHRIIADNLLYRRKFLQYICFALWRSMAEIACR